MKTSILKAALVLLTLTATTVVQAQHVSDIDKEIMEGKIQAAMANQKSFNPLDQIVNMKIELDAIDREVDDLQYEVGTSEDDSNGLVKSLGDKMFAIELLKADFLKTDAETQKEHGYGLALKIDEAGQILKKARKIRYEAQVEVKKAKNFSEENN